MRRIRNYTFFGLVALALFAAPVIKASNDNPCGDNVGCNFDSPCDNPTLCGCNDPIGGICVPIPQTDVR